MKRSRQSSIGVKQRDASPRSTAAHWAERVNETNPFAVLSLIVAPAILTNACSLLSMSTGNRLARAVDRARELAKQLEAPSTAADAADATRRLSELAAAEQRSV